KSMRATWSTQNGTKRETRTNETGAYTAPLLQPGSYRVTVQKDGFKPVSRGGVSLTVDQVARIDFRLEVGTVSETLDVTSQAPLLDQDTSSLGQVIDSSKILNIPLNGRSPFRLVQLTPGVLGVPSTNGQFGDLPVNTMDDSIISINGGRAKTNEVLIDGIPSTTGFVNQMTTIPNVDATQEFKVQSSNLSAEFGRFTGGVINVSTRAGTNELHGSLFEFLRNSAMDSNEFFNKRSGKDIPAFRMNQYGFAVGGPVVLPKLYNGKNRTFFFTDFQGSRWRQGQVFIGTVPTALQRTGNFSQTMNAKGQLIQIFDPVSTRSDPANPGHSVRTPFAGNLIPSSRIDPVGAKLATFYPAPNLPGDPLTQANNFINNAPRGIDQSNQSVRLDHNVSDNQRLFGRFSSNRTTLAQPDTFGNPATPGVGANGRLQLYNYSGGIDDTLVLSPSSVFDVRYGFARFYWARPTRGYGFDERTLGLPDSLVSQFGAPLFPVVGVADFTGLGGGSLLRTGQDTHSLLISMTRLQGNHSLKFGVDVRLRRLNSFNLTNGGGNFSFNRAMTQGPDPNVASTISGLGFASLLLGTPSSGSVNLAAGTDIQNWYMAGYIQDDIRIAKNLTINLGLRYETETPYTERWNQLNRFDFGVPNPAANPSYPNLNGALQFADGNNRTVYNWDLNNFAPRAGFAWTGALKTVFRGGAGLFYAPFSITNSDTGFVPTAGFSSSSPMVATLNGINPYRFVSNPFPDGLVALTRDSLGAKTYLGQGISAWDPNGVTPYSLQWNADLQQALPHSFTLDIAYAGSHGVKLNQGREYNALAPQYLALGTGLQVLQNNPFYGLISAGALSQSKVAQRQLLLPFPEYTSVNMVNASWGNSIYHSMTVKAEKRFSSGINFLLSYTVGKLISDVPDSLSTYDNSTNSGLNPSVQNWYNLRAQRSVSELDVSQNLSFSYVFELPFGPGKALLPQVHGVAAKLIGGWQLSGIVSHRTGTPLILSAPIAGGGNRPNSTGVSAALDGGRSRQQEIAKWFDTSQFTIPSAFTYGDVSRTLPDVRGPGLTNLDISLVKNTTLHERVQLEFRAEAFNATNTPHLWLPNTGAASLQFGQINSTTGSPRVLQMALKVRF
ncbi:MAG: carboxypeptidase-like regulatory domain-containing protein, partial [Acidobacteria bacterium]|nr:carboxypeptidase-like regulatory domain-containing protein [Acidobacteriota bacterium]